MKIYKVEMSEDERLIIVGFISVVLVCLFGMFIGWLIWGAR